MRQNFTPIIVDAPQRSEEWFKARLGNITASEVVDALEYGSRSVNKYSLAQADDYYLNTDGYSMEWRGKMREQYPAEYCLRAGIELVEPEKRKNLRKRIVAERIYKMKVDDDKFINKAMMWGQVAEKYAKEKYQAITGNIVEEAPLMLHPELMTGASADGLVIDIETGEVGNCECKSLTPANHLYDVVLPRDYPPKYFPQMQHQMWIYNRNWCEFIGYDDRGPEEIESIYIVIKRVARDDFYIDEVLEPGVRRFLNQCDKDERKLRAIIVERKNEV